MNKEQLIVPLREGDEKRETSFVDQFEHLHLILRETTQRYGINSEESISKATEVVQFIQMFWTHQARCQPQEAGSFGLDESGHDQLALCMQLLTSHETSICKWGLNESDQRIKEAYIELLSINHTKHRTYSIELSPDSLHIEQILWPRNGEKKQKEEITIRCEVAEPSSPRFLLL